MEKPYRPCVVGVIRNEAGLFLAGERSDRKGAWQLPQGGIEAGEDPVEAVFRELREEIGSNSLSIITQSIELVRYTFPVNFDRELLKGFKGQEQVWFLLEFQPGCGPDLKISDGEFQDLRWLGQKDLISGVVEWKREAYHQGFRSIGL